MSAPTACPAGSFCPSASLTAATPCTPGMYCAGTGLAAVSGSCAAGSYSSGGAATSACMTCAPGQYQDTAAQASCKPCPAGAYCTGRSSGALVNRQNYVSQPDGYLYSTLADVSVSSASGLIHQNSWLSVPSGWEIAPDTSSTRAAAASNGWSSHAVILSNSIGIHNDGSECSNSKNFLEQSGNMYRPRTDVGASYNVFIRAYGQTASSPTFFEMCTIGTFQNAKGQSSCLTCPAGSYCPSAGMTSSILCEPGQYTDQSGARSCKYCPAGSYCPSTGISQPTSCLEGTYNPDTGASLSSACIACPPDKMCPAGASKPTKPNLVVQQEQIESSGSSSTLSGGAIAGVVLACIIALGIIGAVIYKKHSSNQAPVQQVLVQLPAQQPPAPPFNPPQPPRPIHHARQDSLSEDNLADFIGRHDFAARKFVNSHWPAALGPIVHVELNPGLDSRQFVLQRFMYTWNAQPLNCAVQSEYLWHGTPAQNVRDICLLGFDPAKRGMNGQAYGPGEYFGRDANISNGYCRPNIDGLNRMIVALVLHGPQTTNHGNITVVNNPTTGFMSYALPILCVTYGRQPQNYVFDSAFRNGAACDRVLYHQTTAQAAQAIKQNGFNVNVGRPGLVGMGVYFATHPRSTDQKARNKGALIRATVTVGLSQLVPFGGQQGINQHTLTAQGLSSVRIPRNDWNHQPTENGAEYVVYDVTQIKRVEILSQQQYAEIPNLP